MPLRDLYLFLKNFFTLAQQVIVWLYDSIRLGVLKLSERLPWWLSGKETACNAGDTSSIPDPWLGRRPRAKEQPVRVPQYWACAPEPRSHNYRPTLSEPALWNKGRHHNEKPAHTTREEPLPAASRESLPQQQRPSIAKNKNKYIKKKIFEIFDRLLKYQNWTKVLLTSRYFGGASKGPWSTPKKDPKLTGFIWYVKLRGKHCPNSVLSVSDRIITLSPILLKPSNREKKGFGFLSRLVSHLTPGPNNPLWEYSHL